MSVPSVKRFIGKPLSAFKYTIKSALLSSDKHSLWCALMENLLSTKTISVTELREPKKVLDKAGSQPVAVLNRSNVVGYFVPVSAIEKLDYTAATSDELDAALGSLDAASLAVNDYLKDK